MLKNQFPLNITHAWYNTFTVRKKSSNKVEDTVLKIWGFGNTSTYWISIFTGSAQGTGQGEMVDPPLLLSCHLLCKSNRGKDTAFALMVRNVRRLDALPITDQIHFMSFSHKLYCIVNKNSEYLSFKIWIFSISWSQGH